MSEGEKTLSERALESWEAFAKSQNVHSQEGADAFSESVKRLIAMGQSEQVEILMKVLEGRARRG